MDISPIRVVRAQCCAGNPQLRWCARNGRHILQQRCQGGEHRNLNIGSGANTPGRAGRPIEHPGRNLQPSPGCPTREAATENLSASLLNHLMNMDQASGPRMPRIKKLVLRDPVGVPSSCCTTRYGRIYLWRKMRRSPAPPNSPGTFLAAQFSAGYTTNMSGFDLRQGQVNARLVASDSAECVEIHKDASSIDARMAVRHQPQPSTPPHGFLRPAVLSA